jgi:methylmalonyl-CoA/ethylmalonyl-CoA epimerase
MKINHIGYLVGNIEEGIKNFEQFGYQRKSKIIEDLRRRIHICFLERDGYCIELVSPIDEMSVIYQTYKKLQSTPYHICYEVENIHKSLLDLKKQGYVQTQPVEEAIAFEERRVVFLYHKHMGLVELVEMEA